MDCGIINLYYRMDKLDVGDFMNFNNFLKDKGLKVTRGRVAILNVLLNADKSMSAESILDECKEAGVDINLSTVYRGVELFEEKGILDKFTLNDGVFVYRIKGEDHKHLLQCSVCHKEVEVPCPLKMMEEVVQSETGFTMLEHNLIMKGVCKDCKKK